MMQHEQGANLSSAGVLKLYRHTSCRRHWNLSDGCSWKWRRSRLWLHHTLLSPTDGVRRRHFRSVSWVCFCCCSIVTAEKCIQPNITWHTKTTCGVRGHTNLLSRTNSAAQQPPYESSSYLQLRGDSDFVHKNLQQIISGRIERLFSPCIKNSHCSFP